jgi:hypothetical protein
MSSQSFPFTWQQVDQALASLMLNEVSQEFLELARDDLQHIHYQNIGNGNGITVPSQRLEMHRLRAEELAARYYSVYCEVWRSQQKPLSPEFLRAICPNSLRGLFSARVTGVGSEFGMEQMRTQSYNNEWLKAAMAEFRRGMDRLYAKWERLAEIDAKGLEYMSAAAPNSRDVDTAATQVVHARIQLRIVEARLASIEARITMSQRALSATELRERDAYRIKTLEQRLEGLMADKKQFEVKLHEWQRSLDTALRQSAELRRQTTSPSLSDQEIHLAGAVGSERQLQGEEYHGQSSVPTEPNAAGAIGPEREIAQARERVRHFEAEIAATDTNIAAFQQSLTQALVHGTSAFKPADIGKAIRKLHADRKDLEFRRDDWQLMLNTALRRVDDRANYETSLRLEMKQDTGAAAERAASQTVIREDGHHGRPKLNYRSDLKRAIAVQLIRNSKASDLEICRGLDAEGAIEVPEDWSVGKNRMFEAVYKNPKLRPRVESVISKVRADLRRQGLIR